MMAEDCSSALIVRKEIEGKFLNVLEGDTKDYFDEIDKGMEEARKQGRLGLERVKIEKDGLVMWFDINDYGGRSLYRNQDIENALAEVAEESDWAVLCAPIDIYPAGYIIEYNGDLVDDAIATFGLYLNNSISYRDDDPIECVFFNDNYKKLNGDEMKFRVLLLTAVAFSEISENEEAMKGVNDSAFAHFRNNDEDSHMILFLNSSDDDQGIDALVEAIDSLDEEEYNCAVFRQIDKTLFTDNFQSPAIEKPYIYGEASLSGDFWFTISQALSHDVSEDIILSKTNESSNNTKLNTNIKQNFGDSKKLKETALEIFEKMRVFPSQYGFHFSYSPESSWNHNTDFLILTINPSASDGSGKMKKIIPSSPWPKQNDFFNLKNSFTIKKPVQGVCYELARIVNGDESEDPLETAERFANEKAIMASFVPFRTKDVGKIEDSMLDFARNEYWGKIFDIWQPKTIVTFGNPPFTAMREFLGGKYEEMEYNEEKVSGDGTLAYRMAGFRLHDVKTITLIGLPHPTAFGDKGFPTNFPENATANCRLREFLERNLIPATNEKKLDRRAAVNAIIMAQEARRKGKRS